MNKKKIINDPVYGFISIPSELIFDIIEHPWFQRLRRIRQLGLTEMVYPGAIHTRFHHALGAMHLMGKALDNLRNKGIDISAEEYEAAQIAILLHDIGHGPFSHALEESLLPDAQHESISYLFMQRLNKIFNGKLDMSLRMFRNSYKRKFFHELIASQLDIDRLDYLRRDSFFTGVSEGSIGVDRIIAMLNVVKDQLVVEEKGIYSIENFLNARRLMYWQIYLHKTTVSAERMIVNIIKRASMLTKANMNVTCSDALHTFLARDYKAEDFSTDKNILEAYGKLDDSDIMGAIKLWQYHTDNILSGLCNMLLQRKLFKISLQQQPVKKEDIEKVRAAIASKYKVLRNDTVYLFSHGQVSNEAYVAEGQKINILTKTGKIIDIAEASDLPNIKAISKIVKKSYLCYPKNLSL
ncbi:MAG TPA: HD domain-containing protein, partial [Cyclobacteriaceae bacterium]|nr:HD domain-containing protein [Cyclobacteriaceae bacterium]